MNINGLVNMITRRLLNQGVRSGIDHLARGGKDFADMDRDERQQARQRNESMQQTRRVMQMARRFMR